MGLLARQVAAVAVQEGLASKRSPHSLFITVVARHALLQQRAQEPRNAGILARCLDPRPLGDVFLEGDGDIAETGLSGHGYSVTRILCNTKK